MCSELFHLYSQKKRHSGHTYLGAVFATQDCLCLSLQHNFLRERWLDLWQIPLGVAVLQEAPPGAVEGDALAAEFS